MSRELEESDVIRAARDHVALWKAQKVDGLPRAERNAALEETRARLIRAIDALDSALHRARPHSS